MKYVSLGETGIKISRLGFGCMRLPKMINASNPEYIDINASIEMFHYAINNGINYFDTAHTYNRGQSEKALGEALLNGYRNKVYIGTKMWVAGLRSADEFTRQFDSSLFRLKTKRVDLLFLHALTFNTWKEVVLKHKINKILEKYKKAGVIKLICFSSHDSPKNVEAILDTGFFEVVLMQYNMLDKSYGSLFAKAKKKGMGTLSMGPIAGGNLAERNSPWLHGINIASPGNADIALSYVFANKDIDCVLSGMNTLKQLQTNLKIANKSTHFNSTILERIDTITMRLRNTADYLCTWCKYCMPCPRGVHIPLNLKIHTLATVYKAPQSAANMYYRLGKEWFWPGNSAKSCTECRRCLLKCPQHINIVEKLKELRMLVGDKSRKDYKISS